MSENIFEKIVNLFPDEKLLIDEILKGNMNNYDENLIKSLNVTDENQKVTFIHNKGYFYENDPLTPIEERSVSPHWERVKSLFMRICNDNGVSVKRIFRASVNFSGHGEGLYDKIHRDHKFDHYVFLMYLNEFHHGHTFIFDENKKITNYITPEKNKIAIFPNVLHARGYTCPGEIRVVLVVTFEMENSCA